jgi:hypothetical protein
MLPDGIEMLPQGIGRLAQLPQKTWSDGCTGLETLNLSYCKLTTLPDEMAQLTTIKRLDLHGSERLMALPAGLGRLRSLEALDIDDCPGLVVRQGCYSSRGQGGPPAPLASRFHRIPTHFLLNLHGLSWKLAS